jgi:hypothetical protein
VSEVFGAVGIEGKEVWRLLMASQRIWESYDGNWFFSISGGVIWCCYANTGVAACSIEDNGIKFFSEDILVPIYVIEELIYKKKMS